MHSLIINTDIAHIRVYQSCRVYSTFGTLWCQPLKCQVLLWILVLLLLALIVVELENFPFRLHSIRCYGSSLIIRYRLFRISLYFKTKSKDCLV